MRQGLPFKLLLLLHFLTSLSLLSVDVTTCQGLSTTKTSPLLSHSELSEQVQLSDRRRLLQICSVPTVSGLLFTITARPCEAATTTRELDFCLVQTARATAWAQQLSQQLKRSDGSESSLQKAAYLEARLGAKALLTGRMGGGANAAVYRLSTLQFTGCCNDLVNSYGADAQLLQAWREEIAALVEFDGLDSVLDPSPRSSLTLQQYNDKKRVFVQRQLEERIVPTGQRVMQQFPERRARVQQYLQTYYADELPIIRSQQPEA
jgi:hypothetical protein